MKSIRTAFYTKPLVIYLAVALLALTTFAGPAQAMFVPAAPHQASTNNAATVSAARTADLAKIQAALESKIIQQKLMDYGLSPEETMTRVNKLSDDQVHQLATHTDSLQAGGRGIDALTLVLIILVVILIILIVEAPVHSDMVNG